MTEKSQTEELREALAQLPVRQMCCRAAEYAALIRYRRPTAAAEELCEHLRPGLERRGCLLESDDPIDTLTVCPSCPGAFLRGLFISLGTMPDPEKGCRMEFPLPDERARDEVLSVFDTLGIEPRVSHRRGRPLVYLGGSDAIEDILGIMGATREVFDFINAKIKREIRNNVNRATNCDAANIRRTVSASEEQIGAIELLRDGGYLPQLPDELRRTAELRLENPSVSLSVLAALHDESITRSGVNHRLSKLIELAEAARSGNGISV